jgi:hypothetical protein
MAHRQAEIDLVRRSREAVVKPPISWERMCQYGQIEAAWTLIDDGVETWQNDDDLAYKYLVILAESFSHYGAPRMYLMLERILAHSEYPVGNPQMWNMICRYLAGEFFFLLFLLRGTSSSIAIASSPIMRFKQTQKPSIKYPFFIKKYIITHFELYSINFTDRGHVDACVRVMMEMFNYGHFPDREVFPVLVDTCTKRNRPNTVSELQAWHKLVYNEPIGDISKVDLSRVSLKNRTLVVVVVVHHW